MPAGWAEYSHPHPPTGRPNYLFCGKGVTDPTTITGSARMNLSHRLEELFQVCVARNQWTRCFLSISGFLADKSDPRPTLSEFIQSGRANTVSTAGAGSTCTRSVGASPSLVRSSSFLAWPFGRSRLFVVAVAGAGVPRIVPAARQNSLFQANASQLARSLKRNEEKDLRGKTKVAGHPPTNANHEPNKTGLK